MYSNFGWCRKTHSADLFSLQKVLLYSKQWKILDALKLMDEDTYFILYCIVYIWQMFIGYYLSIYVLNIFFIIFMMMSSGESSKLSSPGCRTSNQLKCSTGKRKSALELQVRQAANGKYDICKCEFIITY